MKKTLVAIVLTVAFIPLVASATWSPGVWCTWFPWWPGCVTPPTPTPTPTPSNLPSDTPPAPVSGLTRVQVVVKLDLQGVASNSDFAFFLQGVPDKFNETGENVYQRQISRRHRDDSFSIEPMFKEGWEQTVTRDGFVYTVHASER